MKTLYNKLHIFGQTMLLIFFTLSVLSLGSCSKETLDYNHPDVGIAEVCRGLDGHSLFPPGSGILFGRW